MKDVILEVLGMAVVCVGLGIAFGLGAGTVIVIVKLLSNLVS